LSDLVARSGDISAKAHQSFKAPESTPQSLPVPESLLSADLSTDPSKPIELHKLPRLSTSLPKLDKPGLSKLSTQLVLDGPLTDSPVQSPQPQSSQPPKRQRPLRNRIVRIKRVAAVLARRIKNYKFTSVAKGPRPAKSSTVSPKLRR